MLTLTCGNCGKSATFPDRAAAKAAGWVDWLEWYHARNPSIPKVNIVDQFGLSVNVEDWYCGECWKEGE